MPCWFHSANPSSGTVWPCHLDAVCLDQTQDMLSTCLFMETPLLPPNIGKHSRCQCFTLCSEVFTCSERDKPGDPACAHSKWPVGWNDDDHASDCRLSRGAAVQERSPFKQELRRVTLSVPNRDDSSRASHQEINVSHLHLQHTSAPHWRHWMSGFK